MTYKSTNRDTLFPQLSGLFRKKSLPKVSAWMKKINDWIKKAAILGLLAGAINVNVQNVTAGVTIGNHRARNGASTGSAPNNAPYYDNGTPGNGGTWDVYQEWWGADDTNNVITHLNTANSQGGTQQVRVQQLDIDYVGTFLAYTDRFGNQGYIGAHGPSNDDRAYRYTGTTNLTTIGAGNTVSLVTDVSASFYIANMTKAGQGELQLGINGLEITTVTGNQGVLTLGNFGGGVLSDGTLNSNSVTTNGGLLSQSGTNHDGDRSDFTFQSNATSNIWTIANNLVGNGFNSSGVMNVGGNAVLNSVTNIESGTGYLNVAGSTSVGTVSGLNVLNVLNGGNLDSTGSFTASSTNGSDVYFNVKDPNSTVTTHQNASFATVAGSTVSGIISGGGVWTNTGIYNVAQNGIAKITVEGNTSKLTSTDDIIVGQNAGANGWLIADNNGAISTDTSINVAVANGSKGTIEANEHGTMTAQNGHLNLGELGFGTMNIDGGTVEIKKSAVSPASDAGNAYFGVGTTGYGVGTVKGTNTGGTFNVENNLIVGQAGTGMLFVKDGGTANVAGNHIIADETGSFGRDTVSGTGTLNVNGDLAVGNNGQAGGRYDYIGVGFKGGWHEDPTQPPLGTWVDSQNVTEAPKNTDGTPGNPAWTPAIERNSPGLAIVAGGTTNVTGSAFVGTENNSYGYILLDNGDATGGAASRSKLNIGNDFIVADKGEAYLRIVNGSLVDVVGDMIIGNKGKGLLPVDLDNKGHGTVRVGGIYDTAGKQSELVVHGDLTTGNLTGSQGFLYVQETGKVTVTGDHTIANEDGSFGRDHLDGDKSTLLVGQTLTVGDYGRAGGLYEYRLDGTNADPGQWFDSPNLLLEPKPFDPNITDSDWYLKDGGAASHNNLDALGLTNAGWKTGVDTYWSDIAKNAPGLAITDGAKATANEVYAGIHDDSFSYILIDNKRKTTGTETASLTAVHNMTIADEGDSYVRVLNGGSLQVGTAGAVPMDSLIIGKTNGQGTLRVGNTFGNTGNSRVYVEGNLVTADGTGATVGNIAEGYLYASNGSTTMVDGNHTVAKEQYSFGRDHFNGNNTTLRVGDLDNSGNSSLTLIGDKGQAGGVYQYVKGEEGKGSNDPTFNTAYSDPNSPLISGTIGKWFDSANMLLEPDQLAGDNVNYAPLSWDNVKANSPGFAVTAGAKATTAETIVANDVLGYGYVLLDNLDNDAPSAANRSSWTVTENLTLGNDGNAYGRVLHGSSLRVQQDMTVAAKDGSESTIRINGVDRAATPNRAELVVNGNLVIARDGGTDGNLYAYDKAKVEVTEDFVIAQEKDSYGRAHFDGTGTTGLVRNTGTLIVGQHGQAGSFEYVPNTHPALTDPTYDANYTGPANPLPGQGQWWSANGNDGKWFDSDETLEKQSTADPELKKNLPGLLISRGAVVTAANTVAGQYDADGRGNGYIVVDGKRDLNNTGRSELSVQHALTIGDDGTGYARIFYGGLIQTTNAADGTITIGKQSHGIGTVRVFHEGSEMKAAKNLITGDDGEGHLYVYDGADATVTGDHVIGNQRGSYGNDNIDGHGTTMKVGGILVVGNEGHAGGRYDYIGNGKAGGIGADPGKWFDSENTLAVPIQFLPNGTPNPNWDKVLEKNTPGLAITAGAEVFSGSGIVGKETLDLTVNGGGHGYVVIDTKDKSAANPNDRSKWVVADTGLASGTPVADLNKLEVGRHGEGYIRVINGSLLEVGKNDGLLKGNMIIGSDTYGYGTVRVNGVDKINGYGMRSELTVHGNLTTGGGNNATDDVNYSTGNLYAHDQAKIQVDGNHIIADKEFSVGRDHIDGVGTTMDVNKTLTVGNEGQAGGRYQEDRYINRQNDVLAGIGGVEALPSQHYFAEDPTAEKPTNYAWLDNEARTLENLDRTSDNLGSPTNAEEGTQTGNSPGLAITAGAVVQSGRGVVAEKATSNGYVLIDDKRVGINSSDESVRTRWIINKEGVFGPDGALTIGREGNAFVRILNGSLLQSEKTDIAETNGSSGYLAVIGGSSNPKDGAGNLIKIKDALTGGLTTWRPSEWISDGVTVIGKGTGDERGTIRIEEGAHGVTRGLILGYAAGTQGEISVSGFSGSGIDPLNLGNNTRSLLEIYEDVDPLYKGKSPKGASTLSVSDFGYLWMHQNSELKLNGVGIISNGAILHLSEEFKKELGKFNANDATSTAGKFLKYEVPYVNSHIAQGDRNTPLLDALTSKITIVNARIEGDGTVTGEDGVFIAYDEYHNITGTRTEVDPGQYYDIYSRDERPAYYGTLTFGDQLRMSGNVMTYFDVNSGYFDAMFDGTAPSDIPADIVRTPNEDRIIVTKGDNSQSHADVLAALSGTLEVHARLTDYYGTIANPNRDILVVDTEARGGNPGSIMSMFDNLKVTPFRFFDDPHQEIRIDARGNEDLWITLKRKNNPFEDAGNSYNEKNTGKGLDSVYMDQIKSGRKDWLPVLRYFWYIDNEKDFLDAYRLFSGEIRAHSLLLPMTNQYRYAHNRMDFRECNNPKHDHTKPSVCAESETGEYVKCGAAKHKWKDRFQRLIKDSRIWGSVIYDNMQTDNDGNAGDNGMHRYGFVGGIDKPFLRKESYIGVMVGIDRGSMIAHWQKAKDDDFNIGLYHGTKLFETWEWKNYIGLGVQDYNMRRDIGINLSDLTWDNDDYYFHSSERGASGGRLRSDFLGYSLSGSTELARPFYFGSCKQYMFRPYAALDLAAVWQNGAKEKLGFANSGLVALEYLSAENIRIFARPGFLLERNGKHASLHGGLSYAFLMGGRRYTDVDNKFQIGGDPFNIRGVDDGSGYATWNFGGTAWLGKKKDWSITLEYWGTAGSHSVMNSGQLAAQKKF